MTAIGLQLQAIWTALCQDHSLRYRNKNDDHRAVIRLCTDSLQCTKSLHDWGVYGGVSGEGVGEEDASPT
jgi:hypothetical protein